MSSEKTEIHDMRQDGAPPPPELVPHFGKRVYRGWILPDGGALVLRIEGGIMVMLEAARTDIPNAESVVLIKIGNEIEGASWSYLDDHCPQTEHLKAIRGMRISGFSHGTLEFDSRHGVQVKPDGIRWVMIDAPN